MKTLVTLFTEDRNQLQRELDQTTNVQQAVKLVENRLDTLEKTYIGELNLAQIRLATSFLDTLRQSIAVAAANETQLVPLNLPSQFEPMPKRSPNRFILKLLQGLICLGIFGSSFSLAGKTPVAWMAILLTALLVGLEIVLQLDKPNPENNSTSMALPEVSQVRINSQMFLDNLADALNTIDLAVARVEVSNPSFNHRGIEELPELLNLLQRLIGASFLEKPQMAIELAKIAPQILMQQGITIQVYHANDPQSHRDYFDFEPSIDPSTPDYVTITPALLKGDRLLRRGRVIEPALREAKE